MEKKRSSRYMTRLVDEPATQSSFHFFSSIILHAIGEPEWAEQYVQPLPSDAEMVNDGAKDNWKLGDLLADVRAAIWGDGADRVPLEAHHIVLRQEQQEQFVGFRNEFRTRLSNSLADTASYQGAKDWLQTRYNRQQKEHDDRARARQAQGRGMLWLIT